MGTSAIILSAIAAVGALWAIMAYNGLVKKRTMVEEAWSGISVQLKRRHDLIPNLMNTVKGYASHEKEVFEKVSEARSASMSAGSVGDSAKAESMLTGALRSLFAVAEAYPDLKANENFVQLQGQLSSLEDEIQMARRYYNGSARNLNIAVQTFPTNLIASTFGFKKAEFFELEDRSEGEVPLVSF
ncbi:MULTISPECIES: LemA family protein [Dethiosulfovibrio]|uniref:LemA family protein n=3 Tax=Dethiosulfovibrio TaxID=47054 RepID=D2Z730_9BACT|nr:MULTISPECIES: LemA family protein [Dethiosulfovibrio]MEA3283703.1 LemA family protein [Synergistota bacterium]EFC91277.1 LemA family protein [Dethiosulfovibrio peptidovorans DSM 11002]MCF4114203.1 LemA family protein [Dethiosulfovibrio russensis]MCF4142607.1 LemA family protein [Dethiosulfovibrio marinus]MCF4145126.1 LemA family protein [Dethiosulfovibrio acidaminovorans]